MSNDDDLDPEDGSDIVKRLRAELKERDKRLKESEAAAAEAAELRRERAFRRAGIDPDDPAARYFVKGYDGDLDDLDSIKAAAIEARILQTAPVGADEQAAHQAVLNAAAGAQSTNNEDILARLRSAKNAQEVARIAHEAGLDPLQGIGSELRR